jgi:hypothetical protein
VAVVEGPLPVTWRRKVFLDTFLARDKLLYHMEGHVCVKVAPVGTTVREAVGVVQ